MRLPRIVTGLAALVIAGALQAQPAPLPAGLTLQHLNPGQNLPGAVGVRHANDGSGRRFVIVRTGQIRILDANGTLLPTPFLDIVANPPPTGFTSVAGAGSDERGLLGLAFHPLFAQNGRFYVYYLDGGSDTAVTEYRATGGGNVADAATARVVLRVYQPFTNHNGGDIHFGADGYLYVGLGDGGSGNDPCNSGQSLTSATMSNVSSCVVPSSFTDTPPANVPRGQANSRALLGKMLRIDVDSTDAPAGADLCGIDPALRTYGIPADNPFAGDAGGNAAACDEIYHYGLRNPYRFSFDRDTHDLFIGDVGQNAFEEIDFVGAAGGHNFGWKECEGFNRTGSTTVDCPLAGATDPILVHGRSQAVAITGGFRYRGPYPSLDGVYFYADAYTNNFFFARQNAQGNWSAAVWRTSPSSIVGFGEDEVGNLYLTTLAGQVHRLVLPAGLTVHKTAVFVEDGGTPQRADAGDEIAYTVTLTNSGGEDLSGIEVVDTFGNQAPVALGGCPTTLAIGETAACVPYVYTVVQDNVDTGTAIENSVDATADAAGGATVSASDSVTIATAPAQPAIEVTADAVLEDSNDNAVADVGETVETSYSVHNTGNVTLEAVAAESARHGALSCSPAVLAPGATAHCGSHSHEVQQADIDAGALSDTATATAETLIGTTSVDDSTTVSTPVAAAAPALTLAVDFTLLVDVDADGFVDAGDTVRATFSVHNAGNVTLTDAEVVSSLHGSVACVPAAIAPVQSGTCGPVDRVVVPEDIVAGAVAFSALAGATPPGGGASVTSDAVDASLDADRPESIFADGFEGG